VESPSGLRPTFTATAKKVPTPSSRFDLHGFCAKRFAVDDTRRRRAPDLAVAGSGDNAPAVACMRQIATALYRRERTGKGSYVQPRYSHRVFGRRVFLSRLLSPGRRSTGCMIAPILQMRVECVPLFGWHLVPSCRHASKIPAVLKADGKGESSH